MVPSVDRRNWGSECDNSCYYVIVIYRKLCVVKTVLRRFMSDTPISHTNAHGIRGRPNLRDVDRSRRII